MKARTRITTVIAAFAALLMLASSALANSGLTLDSFSQTTSTANAAVGTTTETTITVSTDWMTIDMGGGIDVTADSSSGAPSYGEQVGEVDVTTRYFHNFCRTRTYNYAITWEDPSTASWSGSGTLIAYMEIDTGFTTVPAYVIEASNGDHSIQVDMPNVTCSNTTSDMHVTTYSHSSTSNSVVATNGGSGTYTLTVTVTDGNGGTHADSTSYANS